MVNIIKEESKEHGRALVAITAYSQVANFFLTRKYEYLDWKMLFFRPESMSILTYEYPDQKCKYFYWKVWISWPKNEYCQGVPLLVTIVTAAVDNFGSCGSTLPNIGRYSCFLGWADIFVKLSILGNPYYSLSKATLQTSADIPDWVDIALCLYLFVTLSSISTWRDLLDHVRLLASKPFLSP